MDMKENRVCPKQEEGKKKVINFDVKICQSA